MKHKSIPEAILKYKYPILILLVAIIILCLPTGSMGSKSSSEFGNEEIRLSSILEDCVGVGEASVLLSDKGAVIVCEGADDPAVRLCITESVRAYTGLGWDEIKVFKMKQK